MLKTAIRKLIFSRVKSLALLLLATTGACTLLESAPVRADTWVAGTARIAKVARDGRIILTLDSVFGLPFIYGTGFQNLIGVDERNGHVWISDVGNNRVFELNAEGVPIKEVTLFSPFGIGIDRRSGAVWTSIVLSLSPASVGVIKLDPVSGQQLVRVTGFSNSVTAIAVAPSGRIWVADQSNNEVVVLTGTDDELNGYDASAPSGPHHLRVGGFSQPVDLSIDPGIRSSGDETAWIADRDHGEVVKLSPTGTQLVRKMPMGFGEAQYISVNERDGSVWAGSPDVPGTSDARTAELSPLGEEEINVPIGPTAVAADSVDGGAWVGAIVGDTEFRLVKLDANGSEKFSVGGFSVIRGIAVTPSASLPLSGVELFRGFPCASHGTRGTCGAYLAGWGGGSGDVTNGWAPFPGDKEALWEAHVDFDGEPAFGKSIQLLRGNLKLQIKRQKPLSEPIIGGIVTWPASATSDLGCGNGVARIDISFDATHDGPAYFVGCLQDLPTHTEASQKVWGTFLGPANSFVEKAEPSKP